MNPMIPHRNLVVSALIAALILIVGVGITQQDRIKSLWGTPKKEAKLLAVETSRSSSMDLFEKDIDGDLLPDWEEKLYGSDPNKADTDGDKTPDGQEVREGRDPTKRGPKDKLARFQDPHFATSSTDIEGKRKEFFVKFLTAQGEDVRKQVFQELIMSKFDPEKLKPHTQLVDLNISSDNSVTALHEYGNAFGVLIKKYTTRAHRTEAEILTSAMETKKSSDLAELQLPAVTYRNFAADLRAMKVPSSLAQAHLTVINGYDGMSLALLSMQELFSNPIQGAGAYQAYSLERVAVTKGYGMVVNKFTEQHVTFIKGEPGAPFYFNAFVANVNTAK